jgi:hypothetical protein
MSKNEGIFKNPHDLQCFVFYNKKCSDFIWSSTQHLLSRNDKWTPDPKFYIKLGPRVMAVWNDEE